MSYDVIDLNGVPFFFRDGTSDSVILKHNVLCDIHEREYKFPPGRPKVIVDIGANIGAISVLMAILYPDATIYSFEPVKENFKLLQMNTQKYPQIKVFNFALGEKNGKLEILTSRDSLNHGGHSFHEFGCDPSAPREEVEVRSVIEVFEELGLKHIDLLKIDCEGAETEILKSLDRIAIEKIGVIVGELHCFRDFELLEYLTPSFHLEFKKDLQDNNYQFRGFSKNLGLQLAR